MRAPRPDTLFRIGGLVACAIVALPLTARMLTIDVAAYLREAGVADLSRVNLTGARIFLTAVPVVTTLLFGAAFWVNTRPGIFDRPSRRAVALLIGQALIALLGLSDYFFIVAAQVPFVFAPFAAFVWLGGQIVVLAAVVAAMALSGSDVIIPEMAGLPWAVGVPVTIVYLTGWQIFAFAVGYLAAGERRSHRELQRSTRELVATQQMLADSSRIAERTQISRELHDTLGHSLTVLNVNLELASHLTDGRAAEAVTKAQTVARMLLSDVREVVHSLGETHVVDLRRALATLVADAHSPKIHLELPDDLAIDDPSMAHAVFRCVQEAITNAARHACAQNLWIRLTRTEAGLDVHIRDDGSGGRAVTPGRGLTGMRERLEGVGGRLAVSALPGQGFAIDAWIPSPRERV